MGQQFRHWCALDASRLLCIMGMMFVVVITFQFFELPYRDFLSSLSPASKDGLAGNGSLLSDDVPAERGIISHMSPFNGLNSTDLTGSLEKDNNYANEKDVHNDLKSEGMIDFNNSSGVDKIVSHEELVDPNVNSTLNPHNESDSRPAPEGGDHRDIILTPNPLNNSDARSTTEDAHQSFSGENTTSTLQTTRASGVVNSSIVQVLDPSTNITLSRNGKSGIISPVAVAPIGSNASPAENGTKPSLNNIVKSREHQQNLTTLRDYSSMTRVPKNKKKPETTTLAVVPISEMNNLLLQSWSSPNMRPRWPSSVDQQLLSAKTQIENAPNLKSDPILYPPLYRNVSMFKRSYELMEDLLKVYIYKEGERPILHQPILKGIYASEGWFMRQMEANKKFVTKDPRKAHLFYLPFSSRNLEVELYVPNSHNHRNLIQYLKDYLDMISAKYPFWNRTEGRDHFLVACHDWAPSETRTHMANCIRALCNADIKEGFVIGKDASLPETYVRSPKNPLIDLGGKRASKRSILAFFAGNMHGYLRPILLKHWENKDPDMKIFSYMPKVKGKMNYIQHMKSSKYCICAKGYEVNSPRVVEAIMYECVPVIISDNYVPPFLEVLNWESFAVFVLEKDIPNLKNILLSISEKRYRVMQMRVKRVQQHFLWHLKPVKYDLFHMILHSIWYNRVFQVHKA